MVIVATPTCQLLAGISESKENLYIQALVPELSIEALDIPIFNWAARPDKIQMHSV